MIEFCKYAVPSPQQFEMLVEAHKDLFNHESDSYFTYSEDDIQKSLVPSGYFIGEKDLESLVKENHHIAQVIPTVTLIFQTDDKAIMEDFIDLAGGFHFIITQRVILTPNGVKIAAVMTYAALKYIYGIYKRYRDNNPDIDEFCKWIEDLPYSILITAD